MGTQSGFSKAQKELASRAKTAFIKYKSKGESNVSFSFNSWIEFPTSLIVKRAFIECLIKVKSGEPDAYEMLTYSFGLFKPTKQKANHLIKKFHIDFIGTPSMGRPPLHPIFHLQSPGELSPTLKTHGIKDTHLEPSLSEPRMCCAPTTLALLTDLLLREFGGANVSALTKITKESFWRSLIKKNEELVLRPYFQACSRFFDDRENSKPPEKGQMFSQDFVYGQS